jgi:hypothetical protein
MTFKPGIVTNPNGRPVGSENRLTRKAKYYAEKFLDEIKRAGISEIAATGKMSDYITLIRTVLPKDHNVKHSGEVTEKKEYSIKELSQDQREALRKLIN